MRLLIVLVLLGLAGCAADQYSATPAPGGPWTPVNQTAPMPVPVAVPQAGDAP